MINPKLFCCWSYSLVNVKQNQVMTISWLSLICFVWVIFTWTHYNYNYNFKQISHQELKLSKEQIYQRTNSKLGPVHILYCRHYPSGQQILAITPANSRSSPLPQRTANPRHYPSGQQIFAITPPDIRSSLLPQRTVDPRVHTHYREVQQEDVRRLLQQQLQRVLQLQREHSGTGLLPVEDPGLWLTSSTTGIGGEQEL